MIFFQHLVYYLYFILHLISSLFDDIFIELTSLQDGVSKNKCFQFFLHDVESVKLFTQITHLFKVKIT